MDFLKLAKKRYSVRTYTSQKVEKEKLDLILEAGRIAPTGANKQPYHILVAQSENSLTKLSQGANIFNAPLALLVCSHTEEAWTRPYDGKNLADIDATIVTDHMMHQATELGLGTVWVCYFDANVLRTQFNLPEHLEPTHILVVGYANDTPQSPDRHVEKRKSLEQTVSFEMI